MRVICTDGRFYEYDFPEDVPIDAEHVHAMLSRHVKPDGRIDDLCLDFSGSYLPIAHTGELRLVSALVVAYVMADQRLVNEVRETPSCTPTLSDSPDSKPKAPIKLKMPCQPPQDGWRRKVHSF